jgi:hypothetical protein
MLKVQTKVEVPDPGFSITYNDTIALFGSCFSDNIGKQLIRFKFNSLSNPFGVLYNPASVSNSIRLLFTKTRFIEEDLEHSNELWFSYAHHSSFSNTHKAECLENINNNFLKAKEHIQNVNVVFLTLGTTWIYRLASTNKIVANCHKQPSTHFIREYLEPPQVTEHLATAMAMLQEVNPQIRFVFTVSPIRHWKDGAIENQRSKASLILGIKELQQRFPNSYYFPSYEIFMDELRDYRYYASDMLHPSEFAIEYLWDRFKDTFFNSETKQLHAEVEKVVKSFEHRTFNTKTDAYKKFKSNLILKANQLSKRNLHFDFRSDIKLLK